MRILFITHYFAPDSGAASNRLTQLAEMLHQRGHEVTVLTTMPHYPTGVIPPDYRRRFTVIEDRAGLRVIQVWLWTSTSSKVSRRLISQLSFMMTCAIRGMFVKRPDVIFIENQPIFTGLAGWFVSKLKRRPYVLNVSDYWPEYLVVAGVTKETSRMYRAFKWLTNLTQRDAAGIVTLLDDLLVKIEARIGKVKSGRVIQNAVNLTRFNPDIDGTAFREKYQLGDVRLITFLGVLGPHIDLETMLQVAAKIKRGDVKFVFVGSGAQSEWLKQALTKSELSHCKSIDWIGAEEVPGFWGATDIHFWALHHNELDKMRFQAKLYEALATGTPTVIAVDGLMSQVLDEHQMGITVAPYDVDALTQQLEHLLDDPDYYHRISQNASEYANAHFNIEKAVDAYESMLKQIADVAF